MRIVGGIAAGFSLFLSASGALAADVEGVDKLSPDKVSESDMPEDVSRVAVEFSPWVDSQRSISGYGAITFAPFGVLDQSGVRVKLEGGAGAYPYNRVGAPAFGQPGASSQGFYGGGGLAVGYQQQITKTLSVTAFAGTDYQQESQGCNLLAMGSLRPSKCGSNNWAKASAAYWGVKSAIDIDYRPSDAWMFNFAGSYSTANTTWWSRAKAGYAIINGVFVGPELGFQGNSSYELWFAGMHVSEYKIGPIEVGVATGFTRNNVGENGVYWTLTTAARF